MELKILVGIKEVKKLETFQINKNHLLFLILLISALGVFSLVNPVSANGAPADVYVATDGIDDPSRGTETEPFLTISYGVANVNDAGTVHLAPGTYDDSQDYDLTITKDVTIQGAGPDQTKIDAGLSNAGFSVSTGKTVTFQDLKIQDCLNSVGAGIYNNPGATLNIQNCVFLNNHATVNGGGIYNNGGTVNIANSQFNSNLAGSGDFGGAIYNSNGVLTITNTIFNGNQAEIDGGAIYSPSGTTTITGCTFTNNHAGDDGGAIYNSGTMTITGSTIEHNTAGVNSGNGGGITNYGHLDITDSSVSYNTAQGDSGAIENRGTLTVTRSQFNYNTGDYGGAIYNYLGALTVKDSTFNHNHARDAGGAIYNQGTLEVTGSTIAYNIADYESGGIHNYNGYEDVMVNFNRIVGNTPNAIRSRDPIDIQYNWWGSNLPDFNTLIDGVADYDPWLVMRYNANPLTILQGGTSTLTADLRYNSDGTFHLPSLGHLPDGTPVTFTTSLGNVGSKSITVGTLSGVATAILRGDEAAGEALISILLDSQSLTGTVIITPVAQAASTTNTAGRTIGMQSTGIPLATLLVAGLMIFGGMIIPKRH